MPQHTVHPAARGVRPPPAHPLVPRDTQAGMHLRQSCPAPATDGALGSCRTTRQGRERDAHDATAGCVPLRGPSGPQQGRGGRAAGTETLLSGQGQRIWEDDRCLTSPGARLVAGMSLDWSGLEDETQLSTLDALEKRMGHTSQGLSHMHELLEYLLSKMTEGREDARQHTRSLCRKLIRNHMETYTALATLRSVLTEVARTDNAKSAILDALETIVGKVEPLGPRPGTGPCAESNATGNAALPCYGLASSFLASLRRDCRGPSVFESDPVGAGAGGSGGGADTQSVESSLRSPAPRDAPIDWLSLSDAETVVHRSGVEDGVSDDASSQSDDNSNSNSNSNVPSYPTEPPSRHLHRRRRSTGAIQTPSSAAELRKETPHTSLQPLQRALSELISAGADARVIREVCVFKASKQGWGQLCFYCAVFFFSSFCCTDPAVCLLSCLRGPGPGEGCVQRHVQLYTHGHQLCLERSEHAAAVDRRVGRRHLPPPAAVPRRRRHTPRLLFRPALRLPVLLSREQQRRPPRVRLRRPEPGPPQPGQARRRTRHHPAHDHPQQATLDAQQPRRRQLFALQPCRAAAAQQGARRRSCGGAGRRILTAPAARRRGGGRSGDRCCGRRRLCVVVGRRRAARRLVVRVLRATHGPARAQRHEGDPHAEAALAALVSGRVAPAASGQQRRTGNVADHACSGRWRQRKRQRQRRWRWRVAAEAVPSRYPQQFCSVRRGVRRIPAEQDPSAPATLAPFTASNPTLTVLSCACVCIL